MQGNLQYIKIKRFVSICVAVLIVLFFYYSNPLWLLEFRVQDALYQNPRFTYPEIVIFGIDEEAIDKFGPWHLWSRSIMADAINILNTYENERPAVIAVDVMYDAPGIPYADEALIEAIRNGGNVVLASSVDIGFERQGREFNQVITRHMKPFDALLPYASYGLIDGILERDGVIRNALLSTKFQGEELHSFAVMVASKYKGQEPEYFTQGHNLAFIPFTGTPGNFFEHSFAEIFCPDFQPFWYHDQIVMIGPWAVGMMDSYMVPIYHGAIMYGVEIHANILQMLLEGLLTQRVPSVVYLILLVLFVLLGMFLGELFDFRVIIVGSIVLAVAYFFASLLVFSRGWVLPILTPLTAFGAVCLYQLVYNNVLQTIERNRIKNSFRKYIDPSLADALIADRTIDSEAVGKRRHIAVLFVDVRGFTTMTEKLRDTPELVVESLNRYLELTTKSVFDNGGSVDKFVGDAAMALFNGFVPQEDYIYSAVKTAWDMIQGAPEVTAAVKESTGVNLSYGIGIHCGEAIVGNLGPAFRKDYTAIGDTVNVAARLESSASPGEILISKDVYDEVKDRVEVESVGEILLKGRAESVEVFELIGLK